MLFFRRALAALIVALFVRSTPANASQYDYRDPPQGLFSDEWLVIELAGEKAGFAHSTLTRDGNRIDTEMIIYFKIARAQQQIEITISQKTQEKLDGTPLNFDMTMNLAAGPMRTQGQFDGKNVDITSEQFGFKTKKRATLDKLPLMSWGLLRQSFKHGFAPGTQYEVDVYEPSLFAEGTLHGIITIGQKERIELPSGPRDAIKVTTTLQTAVGKIDSIAHIDEKGNTLRATTAMAGIEMTMLAADRDTARKAFEPPEFFMDTLVRIQTPVDPKAKSVRYRLSVVGDGRKIPDLPTTAMQSVQRENSQSAIVEVKRLNYSTLRAATSVPPNPELAEFLAASPSLNIEDDVIIKMAAKAAGRDANPYITAGRLRAFVTDEIQEKNLRVGFATASDVSRNMEGDCTEHAVLLAALGRARGIPSRVAVGLAYLPIFLGEKNIFGFHMWTQFHIAGQWVDMDAALRETDCSPTRITLATSSLSDSSVGDLTMAIMDVVRGLKIEVVSSEAR
jgi:transglutaminase superfamily protein